MRWTAPPGPFQKNIKHCVYKSMLSQHTTVNPTQLNSNTKQVRGVFYKKKVQYVLRQCAHKKPAALAEKDPAHKYD